MITFFRLIKYIRPQTSNIILATVCSVLNTIFDIFPEIILGFAVDNVVYQESSFLGRMGVSNPVHQMLVLAGITTVAYILESLFEFFYSLLWRNLSQSIQHKMRIDTYNHLQHMPMSFFEGQSTGNILTTLVGDINILEHFINESIHETIKIFTSTLIIGTVFFYVSPMMALFTFVPAPIIILITFYFQRAIKARYASVREVLGNLASLITSNIHAITAIKSNTTEAYELQRVKNHSRSYQSKSTEANFMSALFTPLVRMPILVGSVFSLTYGGIQAIRKVLPVGQYSALVFLVQRLLWPFTETAFIVDTYEKAMASTRRVLDFLQLPVPIYTHLEKLDSSRVAGAIVFDNVTFGYPNRSPLFKGLSFTIPAGKTVGFVGQTGAGKSTITKLLLRFYDPQKGSITLDGTQLTEYTPQSIRNAIGLVGQDSVLMHGSIKDNIRYGSFTASDDAIIAAAKTAEAYDFIMQLPQGFNTIVAERGQTLSGGQRQRICIARALVKNPPIYIFDEATSAVDNETESAIKHSIERVAHEHTTIVIAHRLAMIRQADTIFVLDQGKIAQSGTHDKLVKQPGIYQRLWYLQTGVENNNLT